MTDERKFDIMGQIKVAELIQQDFDKKWFEDRKIRTINEEMI